MHLISNVSYNYANEVNSNKSFLSVTLTQVIEGLIWSRSFVFYEAQADAIWNAWGTNNDQQIIDQIIKLNIEKI